MLSGTEFVSTSLLLLSLLSLSVGFAVVKVGPTPGVSNVAPKLVPIQPFFARSNHRVSPIICMTTSSSESIDEEDEEEEEEVEPGKMRVSEIKAELTLRGASFADCFDKESLVKRLEEARLSGKADPSILDDFNKKKLEATFKGEAAPQISDEQINAALSSDGKLPGGLSPEQLKKLVANPELMVLLQSVKMQEVMKLMMTSGPEALQKAMAEDPEVRETVMKLNEVMAGAL